MKGYRLVPVEPTEHQMKIARSMTLQQEQTVGAEYRAMVKASPTPPQPIYDEAKERELFAEFGRRIVARDAADFPIRWRDCVADEEIEEHLNTWLACAQSRAQSVEE